MDDFEKELKIGFLDEAEQSISDVEKTFLELEAEPQSVEHLNKIFRLAHNLKGSSRAVGFDLFGVFTHEFESFILKIKNGEIPVTAKAIGQMLQSTDFIRVMITQLKNDLSAQLEIDQMVAQLVNYTDVSAANATPAPEAQSAKVEVEEIEETQTSVKNQEFQNFNNVKDHQNTAASTQGEKAQTVKQPSKATAGDESIRVGLNKVEQLLNYVGEMVILQSVLYQNTQALNNEKLNKTVSQLGKIAKEIQDVSMGLRMIPVKQTFQKMQRIVRDTAQSLEKNVQLVLKGEDTEIDKNILESVNDPLVHLVRNSVDHGIENAELRKSKNKSEQGKVELRAFHRSGRLIIEVIDDGGGLDADKLKKIALSKGIINESAALSEQECFKLIFAPGFSTKDKVTEISGRGVGMDVVKTNIEKIGGEIQIESILGAGTTIRISLPLTLAIVEGLVVSNASNKFVIPLNHVCETLQPKASQIYREKNIGTVLLLRGENIPLYHLGDFFNEKRRLPETQMIALVFRNNQKYFALMVEDILMQQQVVIKRLNQDMQNTKGISGTTILGDGKPCLIIEPSEILQRAAYNKDQFIDFENSAEKENVA